jgi:hypothetical protein
MQPIAAKKITEKLRPNIDERRSEWVCFPNGRQYLLPVVARHQKIVPTFSDDGTVEVGVTKGDDHLANHIDAFLEILSTVDQGNIILKTTESISAFFALVRKLLIINYDFSADDLQEILTVNNQQLKQLFNTILLHVVKQ